MRVDDTSLTLRNHRRTQNTYCDGLSCQFTSCAHAMENTHTHPTLTKRTHTLPHTSTNTNASTTTARYAPARSSALNMPVYLRVYNNKRIRNGLSALCVLCIGWFVRIGCGSVCRVSCHVCDFGVHIKKKTNGQRSISFLKLPLKSPLDCRKIIQCFRNPGKI